MRPGQQIEQLEEIIEDYKKSTKLLRDEVLRLRNGLRMLLVADSWEEQPGPVLVEYVNGLLEGKP